MADAKFRIAQGTQSPYHEQAPTDKYEAAALGVLADLGDRKGIKWELEGVDLDVRKEIVASLAQIIKEAMQ